MSGLEEHRYDDRGTALTGWLARPAGVPRGAVLVFPTIANLSPAVEAKALRLAQTGFVVLVADFYGKTASSPEEWRLFAGELRADVDHYRARLAAALTALLALPEARGLRASAIGFCMGGQAALELARSGTDLALVASFHGLLETGRRASADTPVKARILVCHGDRDPMVPREQVLAFWEEMDGAGANWHFHAYAGVKHGFTDPGSDARGIAALGYDASADRQSWASLGGLLDEIYG
ncbi:dienelactone hydrolase family protein [Novosphingobium flavum]|uniref:Dienelactone hydrolase family protein n=1 Tax=Novosphingobium flavum TaxID=1778672 RepID=A0A7X1FPV2_9SPHN|nr:dienelactone hydrolase family protein [Novosphingobium flavum]MBC2664728.1 dienelactone hydrolase family protein [Novosphingobium flavum]